MLAFAAVLVVIPLAVLSIAALRIYLRRKITKRRHAGAQGPIVIEGEYTVIAKGGPGL